MINEKVIEACYSVLEFEYEISGYEIRCDGREIDILDKNNSYFFEQAIILIGQTNKGFGIEVSWKNKIRKFHEISSPGILIDKPEDIISFIKIDIISILKEL